MRKLGYILAALLFVGGAFITSFLFLPMPKSTIKYIASNYPEYFITDRNYFSDNFNILEKILLRSFDLKLQIDWSYQIYKLLDKKSKDDIEFINSSVTIVKNMFLTQRQFQGNLLKIDNTLGVFLIRGYGYCDYINGALARILAHKFDDVVLFGSNGLGNIYANHAVVRIKSPNGEFFADAWSDVALWGFSDKVNAEYRNRIPSFSDVKKALRRSLPGTIAENYRKGFVFNRYDWQYSFTKAIKRIWLLIFSSKTTQITLSNQFGKNSSDVQEVKTSKYIRVINDQILQIYLINRIDHLFGNTEFTEYKSKYFFNNCDYEFCLAARLFSRNQTERSS